VPLGDIIELRYGKALKAENRSGAGFPVIGSGGVAGAHESALVTTPTIVVGRKGSIGSLTYAPDGCWPIDTAYFTHAKRELDLRWLFWTMQSLGLESMNKSAAVPGLNREDAYRTGVPLPPLPEQRRIAAILDEADALRTRRKASNDLLQGARKEVFRSLFGAIEPLQRREPSSTLAEIASGVWDCPHSTPTWTESGVTCVRTSNLGRGYWNWDDHRYVSEATHRERTKRADLDAGDIVLSREGTVGIGAIIEPGMRLSMGQRLVQVRPDATRTRSEYLLAYLLESTDPAKIGHLMVGSTSTHLNVRDLRALPVYVPPMALQDEFASLLAGLAANSAKGGSQMGELDSLFASLQHRAFRGEL